MPEATARSWILYHSQRITEAEQSEEAVRRNPNFAMARLMLAAIHRTQNKWPELLEDLTIYLRLDPAGPGSGRMWQVEETRQPCNRDRQKLSQQIRTGIKDSGSSHGD